jgi:signal transduction histidine kinase/DNA-binding NarL/FixJ family response regulator
MAMLILLVEDHPGDARLVREVLADADTLSYQIKHAMRLDDGLAYLAEGGIDVVLLDLGLPDAQGLETVVRMIAAAPALPIVVLTSLEDEELAREALRVGAQDYLPKADLEARLLVRSIRSAVERKRREIEQRRGEEELRLLRTLALALGEAEDLESALTLVLEQVCEVTGWVTGEAWLPDGQGAVLVRGPVHVAGSSELEHFHAGGAELAFTPGTGPIGRVWLSGEPEWIGDVTGRADFYRAELATESGLHAAVAIPVRDDREVVAVLAFYHFEQQSVDPRLIDLVSTTVAQFGALIRRRRAAERLTSLWSVAAELSEALAPEQVAEVVVRHATQTLGAASACLAVLTEDGEFFELLDSRGLPLEVVAHWGRFRRDAHAPLPRCVETGEAEWIDSAERLWSEYPEFAATLAGTPPRSLVALPLVVKDHALGAISLSYGREQRWEPADRAFLLIVATQAAQALERAHLYAAERDARGRAEAVLRARDEVLGVVAHDLRDPLSAISMTAYLLRETDLPSEKRQEQLEGLIRSAEQMDRLIQDLLEVACLEAGQLSVDLQPVAVAPLVAEARELMAPLAAEKGLEIRSEAPVGLPTVSADRHRLLQVLSNLIGNAIKFTSPGGRVVLGAEVHNDSVRFAVTDTGPGIPREHLPRLFERFWQATKADRGGAGLGLSIARGILEAHGGRIWAESEVGVGSTFFFAVPIRSSGEQDSAETAEPLRRTSVRQLSSREA